MINASEARGKGWRRSAVCVTLCVLKGWFRVLYTRIQRTIVGGGIVSQADTNNSGQEGAKSVSIIRVDCPRVETRPTEATRRKRRWTHVRYKSISPRIHVLILRNRSLGGFHGMRHAPQYAPHSPDSVDGRSGFENCQDGEMGMLQLPCTLDLQVRFKARGMRCVAWDTATENLGA